MNGIAGVTLPGCGKIVEKMLEVIAQRGKGKPRIIESANMTLGVVWTPTRSMREIDFKGPCLDKILALVYMNQPPSVVSLARDNLPFALAVDTPLGPFLARDALGIRPLYYSSNEKEIKYFASEVKALLQVSHNIHEFPPGFVYNESVGWQQFSEWKYHETYDLEPTQATTELKQKLDRAVDLRVVDEIMGCWLSGGIDSSAIASLARPKVKELHSFAGGVPGSPDLEIASFAAKAIGTSHHEVLLVPETLLDVLPQVIWTLESFDASVVRSGLINYLLARVASDFVDNILSGEGGDELFAGYYYLKSLSPDELHEELLNICNSLHNTALQREDRCSGAFGLKPQMPFLDREVCEYVMKLPVEYKLPTEPPRVEKWILRKAFEGLLPEKLVWRQKEKMWEGAGIGEMLAQVAEEQISDSEFAQERLLPNGWHLSSKEELMYYRIFREYFGELEDLSWMGRTQRVLS